eukprot:1901239-Prymnesium_polylepis.1
MPSVFRGISRCFFYRILRVRARVRSTSSARRATPLARRIRAALPTLRAASHLRGSVRPRA